MALQQLIRDRCRRSSLLLRTASQLSRGSNPEHSIPGYVSNSMMSFDFSASLSPNPPNRVVVALERDLTGMERGPTRRISGGGASSGPVAGEGSRSWGGRRQQGTLAGRFVRREWEKPPTDWWMRASLVGRLSAQRSGREWQGVQSDQGASELGLPRPMPGKMQGEAAGRAGEAAGEGEEAPSQGLGGHHLLTQTEAGGPAGQQLCWLSRGRGNYCRAIALEKFRVCDRHFGHLSPEILGTSVANSRNYSRLSLEFCGRRSHSGH